jgi:hypothetical protein
MGLYMLKEILASLASMAKHTKLKRRLGFADVELRKINPSVMALIKQSV